MGLLESRGYRFNSERERAEAEQWLRKHPEMTPPKDEMFVEPEKLMTWQISRRQKLAIWFGDWADTGSETFDRVSVRDAARRQLIKAAGLTPDEMEILNALMDEWPRREITGY